MKKVSERKIEQKRKLLHKMSDKKNEALNPFSSSLLFIINIQKSKACMTV